jgi:hypothetical protein
MPPSAGRLLGGVFGIKDQSASATKPPFSGLSVSYFLSARSAIYALCVELQPRVAWLPAYLCPTMLEPFGRLNVPVCYYDAGPGFGPPANWLTQVQASDLVFAIHYFGFPNRELPVAALVERGAVVIEDASQAMFARQIYPDSLYLLFSARKFFGVPDGGILASVRGDAIRCRSLEPPPADWWSKSLAVIRMRAEFDGECAVENHWFQLFQSVEASFPVGLFRSSDLARNLIETGTDYEQMKKARRRNYCVLAERLGEFAAFPSLDEETVPLGFPVQVDERIRDRVLTSLYEQRIYPPVHWRLEADVPPNYSTAHALSRRILTLICDQRYTADDMVRQTDAFLAAIS